MLLKEIIRKAIPTASDALCEHLLWSRTPFPFSQITARMLYKAAHRYKRVQEKGLVLCALCNRITDPEIGCVCARCHEVLYREE